MKVNERWEVMMIIGCLRDIAEKAKEFQVSRQITITQLKLERAFGMEDKETVAKVKINERGEPKKPPLKFYNAHRKNATKK
jgi:predicted ATPase